MPEFLGWLSVLLYLAEPNGLAWNIYLNRLQAVNKPPECKMWMPVQTSYAQEALPCYPKSSVSSTGYAGAAQAPIPGEITAVT